MALSDFLTNLRTAAMFLEPKVEFDGPGRDAADFRESLKKADIWLTPKAVDGFDPMDFAFLPPTERAELDRNVEAFRRPAGQVPRDRPATPEQAEAALTPFLAILRTLQPYLDRDWLQVYRALAGVSFPPEVVGTSFEVSPDLTGDPAVWVWVTVEDAALKPDRLVPLTRQMEGLIGDALRRARINYPVYVGLRARSEMPEVIGSHAGA